MRTVSIHDDYKDIDPFPDETMPVVLVNTEKKPVSTFHEFNGTDKVITGDSTAGDNNALFQKYAHLDLEKNSLNVLPLAVSLYYLETAFLFTFSLISEFITSRAFILC